MIQHRVRADDIARVVRKIIPAMINNSLERPDGAKKGSLAIVQSYDTQADGEANGVDWDRL